MAERQAIRDAAPTESVPRSNSHAQAEAMNLLNNGTTRTERRPLQQQGRTLDVPNVFRQLNPSSDIGACTTQTPRCESDSRWKPDYQRRSEGGRNWDREAQSQRAKPLDTDHNGNYRVQRGDCLDDIARRMLRGESGSQNPSRRDVADATKRILEANPQLRCNPELIRPGMELRLPRRSDGRPDGRPEGNVDGKPKDSERNNRDPKHERETKPVPETKRETETRREPNVPKQPNLDLSDRERNSKPPSSGADAIKKPNCDEQLEAMKKCLEAMRRQLEELQRKPPKLAH